MKVIVRFYSTSKGKDTNDNRKLKTNNYLKNVDLFYLAMIVREISAYVSVVIVISDTFYYSCCKYKKSFRSLPNKVLYCNCKNHFSFTNNRLLQQEKSKV